MLSVPLRMIDQRTGKEIEPSEYKQFAAWTQTIGFRAQTTLVGDDQVIWRGLWQRDDVGVIAETPDGYDTHVNAMRAAARCFLAATAPNTTVVLSPEQIALLRRCFDVGAPTAEDLASGTHVLDRADVEECADLLRDAYAIVPPSELDLSPNQARTLHTCFLVGAEVIDDGNVLTSEYHAIINQLRTAMRA